MVKKKRDWKIVHLHASSVTDGKDWEIREVRGQWLRLNTPTGLRSVNRFVWPYITCCKVP
jgi:hypothetical protein